VDYTFHPQQPMSICGLHLPSSTAHVNMWTTPSVLNSPCQYVEYCPIPQQPMSICGISPHSPTAHVNMWNIAPFPNSPQHVNMVTSCFTLHFHSNFFSLSQYCCFLLTNFYSYLNFSISIKLVELIKLWSLGLYSLL